MDAFDEAPEDRVVLDIDRVRPSIRRAVYLLVGDLGIEPRTFSV